jgi:hypothetical protein
MGSFYFLFSKLINFPSFDKTAYFPKIRRKFFIMEKPKNYKKRNRNELMIFFLEKRPFTTTRKGKTCEITEAIFPSQKDILRILSNLPDHRLAQGDLKLECELTKLSSLLNGKRLRRDKSLSRLQEDLTQAIQYRLKNELQVDEKRFDWLMAIFQAIFNKIYPAYLAEHKAARDLRKKKRLEETEPLPA